MARLSLTRRVLQALEPLEGATIEADVENPALAATATAMPLLRTDLLVRALDLRIRVAVLPGADAEDLDAYPVLEAGLAMLMANPETASVVVIADDQQLSCRVVEPFDRPDAVVTARVHEKPSTLPRGGPVASVLRAHLRQINPGWEPPARIAKVSGEIDDVALEAASGALADLQAKRKNKGEWKEARDGLSQGDVDWIRELAIDVLLNGADAESINARLDRRAGKHL